ncbi:MAG: hypothetical protein HQ503_04395 [Rhodospirillales bacterium]|nr:hypothetical protein [Rhodospirillales bacterium]
MSSETQSGGTSFIGILILKENKWTPHRKFDANALGTALLKAQDMDAGGEFEAVKVVEVIGGKEQKDKWVSPSLEARQKAREEAKLLAGVKQTQAKIEEARKARFK